MVQDQAHGQPEAAEPLLPRLVIEDVEESDEVPASLGAEVPRLLRLALPASADSILNYAAQLITVAQLGRAGSLELSAFSLANSVFTITGFAPLVGIAAALETLAGQAYGAAQYPLLGALLQRAVLLCLLSTLAPMLLWVTLGKRLMLALTPGDPTDELAAQGALALQWLAPALPLEVLVHCCARYLSSQRVVTPSALISGVLLVVRPGLNHLLIICYGWGVVGAALAFVLSHTLTSALYVVACVRHNARLPAHRKAWRGWSWTDATSGWRAYLAVAAPSTLLVCAGWWPSEVITLLGGRLPQADDAVGALGILFSTRALSYLAVGGLGSAACIRVANQLGSGRGRGAARSLGMALVLGVAVAACAFVAPLWLARRWWVGLFTRDAAVRSLVLACFPALLLSLLGDACDSVLGGGVRGCGRQALAASVTIGSYWVVGLPLAWVLGLHQGYGAPGLWVAVALSTTAQGVLLGACIACLDWRQEAAAARARVLAAG